MTAAHMREVGLSGGVGEAGPLPAAPPVGSRSGGGGPLLIAVVGAALAVCLWYAATRGQRAIEAYIRHGRRPLLRVATRLFVGACLLTLSLMAAGLVTIAAVVALTASIGWVAAVVLVDAIASYQAAWENAAEDKLGSVLRAWMRDGD